MVRFGTNVTLGGQLDEPSAGDCILDTEECVLISPFYKSSTHIFDIVKKFGTMSFVLMLHGVLMHL